MKYLWKFFLIISLFSLTNSCTDDNTTDPAVDGFKGYIYHSSSLTIYRINMNTQVNETLFTNVRYPEITAKGEILAVEDINPKRLILTDLTGANRKSVLEATTNLGPIHRREMIHPRISYNQKYIAYSGNNLTSGLTFVIDAITGELVATIGDFSVGEQYYRPSWAPDGSLYVNGLSNRNNGIYKISSDFKTITKISKDLTNVEYPSVSPDGKSIAFIKDNQVWTMGIDGSNPEQLYVAGLQFYIPTWSPDSKYIASVSRGGGYQLVYIFDIKNNTYTELEKSGGISYIDQMCWVY